MRTALAVAVVGVLVLASSAGADPVMNFDAVGGPGFGLSNAGVLTFNPGANNAIQDTVEATLLGDVVKIAPITIQGPRVVSDGGLLVTYTTVTPASVVFSIWSPGATTEYLTGNLATNQLNIFFGGPIVFSTLTANLTSITQVTATPGNTIINNLESAGQASVLLTLGQNIDPYLNTATATTGDLSGSVTVSPVPEPATLALTGLGVMALFIRRKK
jgi:hypothetical protein